jgi:hypothetical protein
MERNNSRQKILRPLTLYRTMRRPRFHFSEPGWNAFFERVVKIWRRKRIEGIELGELDPS